MALLPAAAWVSAHPEQARAAGSASTVYELRVYHANEGKLDDLLKRFREHTTRLFEKHGMKNVAYWKPGGRGQQLEGISGRPRMAESARRVRDQWQAGR
jgi:hypothetical protein